MLNLFFKWLERKCTFTHKKVDLLKNTDGESSKQLAEVYRVGGSQAQNIPKRKHECYCPITILIFLFMPRTISISLFHGSFYMYIKAVHIIFWGQWEDSFSYTGSSILFCIIAVYLLYSRTCK